MKYSGNIALIMCLALTLWMVVTGLTTKNVNKVGVIQMEKLIYSYKGMKEATDEYSIKLAQWKHESDSLESELTTMYRRIQLDSLDDNKTKLDKDIRSFLIFKSSFQELAERNQKQAEDEDKQMTLGVINQVNEAIKNYAKREGFDVILCNSQNQTIGYAKDALDVTKQVLELANNEYEGNK